MKNSVCAATLVLILFSLTRAWADGAPAGIQEIENGACWISETTPGHWKIASFNDRTSGAIDPELIQLNLFTRIDAQLKSLGLVQYAARDFETHLRCSGGAHEVMLSLAGGDQPLCVTTDLTMNRLDIDSNIDAQPGQPCIRSLLGQILVFPKHLEDTSKIVALLQAPERAGDIAKAEDNRSWIKVQLTPRWYLKESAARDALLADATIAPLTNKIIYNYRLDMGGTLVDLGKSQYPGFPPAATSRAPKQ